MLKVYTLYTYTSQTTANIEFLSLQGHELRFRNDGDYVYSSTVEFEVCSDDQWYVLPDDRIDASDHHCLVQDAPASYLLDPTTDKLVVCFH